MLAHIDPNFVLLEDQVSLGLDELPEYGVFPSIGLPSDPGGFNCGTTFLRYFRVNILSQAASIAARRSSDTFVSTFLSTLPTARRSAHEAAQNTRKRGGSRTLSRCW